MALTNNDVPEKADITGTRGFKLHRLFRRRLRKEMLVGNFIPGEYLWFGLKERN